MDEPQQHQSRGRFQRMSRCNICGLNHEEQGECNGYQVDRTDMGCLVLTLGIGLILYLINFLPRVWP